LSLGTGELILLHLLEESLVREKLSNLLEAELVSVAFTDLFTSVSEDVAKSLKHTAALDHVVRLESKDGLLPLLRTDRVVLFIVLASARFGSIRLVRTRVTAGSKVLRGALLVFLDDSLVLSGTSRIVESLSD